MAMAFILWTCVIMLLSVMINLFAIYKSEFLHRLISLGFLLMVIASFIYYFPLENKQTPMSRMLSGEFPTWQDLQTGVQRLTFNFDFANRTVEGEENYINQKLNKTQEASDELKENIKKQKKKLDILVVQFEENK